MGDWHAQGFPARLRQPHQRPAVVAPRQPAAAARPRWPGLPERPGLPAAQPVVVSGLSAAPQPLKSVS